MWLRRSFGWRRRKRSKGGGSVGGKVGGPLKRVFLNAKGVFMGRFTETYAEFNLNPKIEGKEFDLPK
jgi:hypothetical protein